MVPVLRRVLAGSTNFKPCRSLPFRFPGVRATALRFRLAALVRGRCQFGTVDSGPWAGPEDWAGPGNASQRVRGIGRVRGTRRSASLRAVGAEGTVTVVTTVGCGLTPAVVGAILLQLVTCIDVWRCVWGHRPSSPGSLLRLRFLALPFAMADSSASHSSTASRNASRSSSETVATGDGSAPSDAPFASGPSAAQTAAVQTSAAQNGAERPTREASTDAPDSGAPRGSSWIDDEEALRDEGVLFGLAGRDAAVDAKTDAIRLHFAERIQAVQRRRSALEAALGDARERREALKRDVDRHRECIDSPDEPPIDGGDASDVAPHYFLRYLVGLVLAMGLCALNYVLIYELVAPRFEHPWFVAAGVLMAGMFALFQPSSILYNNDDDQGLLQDAPAELWKQRISEFGVPFAAALFAVVWRLGDMSALETGVSFLFVFMLFLFGGKLFLSMIPQLSLVTRNVLRDRRIRQSRKAHRGAIADLRSGPLADAHRECSRLRDRLTDLPTTDELQARCDRAVAVFKSEVALARDAREQSGLDVDVPALARRR